MSRLGASPPPGRPLTYFPTGPEPAPISFFLGGITTSATPAVRGPGVGMLNGLPVWTLVTTLFAVVSFFGAGVVAGTVGGLVSRFISLNALQHAESVTPTMLSKVGTAAG